METIRIDIDTPRRSASSRTRIARSVVKASTIRRNKHSDHKKPSRPSRRPFCLYVWRRKKRKIAAD
jgi:hypothetical protein